MGFVKKRRLIYTVLIATSILLAANVGMILYLHFFFHQMAQSLYSDVYKNAEKILNADRDLYQALLSRMEMDEIQFDTNTQQALDRVESAAEGLRHSRFHLNSSQGEQLISDFARKLEQFEVSFGRWLQDNQIESFEEARSFLDQAEATIDLYAVEAMGVAQKKNRELLAQYSLVLLILTAFIFWLGRKYVVLNEQMREKDSLYRLIGDNMSDMILITDRRGRILYASSSTGHYLGVEPAKHSSLFDYIDGADQSWDQLEKHLESVPYYTFEAELGNHHGNRTWIEMSVTEMEGFVHEESRYLIVSREITERKYYERQMHRLAYYDTLTGIKNRAAFSEAWDMLTGHQQRHETLLLLLNCDRFQQLNDTLGQLAADEFLKKTAATISDIVSGQGEAFRLGGDEFAVLLSNIQTEQQVTELMNSLLSRFRQGWNVEGQNFICTVSIGAAYFPAHGHDAETLVKSAKLAVYQAKKQGGNQIVMFNDSMLQLAVKQIQLKHDLYSAVSNGEMYLVYQSQIDLTNGRIIGYEALIRWKHPYFGVLLPVEFIPLAEESGVIVPIGKWALLEACKQNMKWLQEGRSWVVSVNIAASHLYQTSFVADVKHALEASVLPPQYLKIELTEGTIIHYMEEVLEKMKQLKALGVGLSIDDFGTGYSSLSYLKKFPIDTIKIDKSFVHGLPNDQDDSKIVQAIIQMGHNLGMKLVAEGTETAEQILTLKDWKCDEAQGFYFGRPCPSDQFDRQLNETNKQIASLISA